MKRIILLGLLLAGNIGLRAAGTEGLRCEYLDNPLGIDDVAAAELESRFRQARGLPDRLPHSGGLF